MEESGHCLIVDKDLYQNWRRVGVLENLHTDGDIARFLLALYLRHHQTEGVGCQVRCGQCQRPLTLHCDTCQWPAQLTTTNTQHHHHHPPPLSSLPSSTTPKPPPRKVSDATGALISSSFISNAVQHTCLSTYADALCSKPHQRLSGDCKDEEIVSTENLMQEEGGDIGIADSLFGPGDTETQSVVRECQEESDFAATKINLGRVPSSTGKVKRLQKSRKRMCELKDKDGGNRNLTFCTQQINRQKNEDATCNDRNKVSTNVRNHKQGVSFKEEGASLCVTSAKFCKIQTSINKESVENSKKDRRKWKPCAWHDLEDGRVLPAEARRLAQVHVYDEGFFERRGLKDDPSKCSKKQNSKTDDQTLSNSAAPKLNGENIKKRYVSSTSFTDDDRSDNEEDGPEVEKQSEKASCGRSKQDRLVRQRRNFSAIQTLVNQESEEGVPGDIKTHTSQEDISSSKQILRILVSKQRIQPLKTKDGHYARFSYSFFECALCGKAFTRKRAFNNHIRTHSNQPCSACDANSPSSCGNGNTKRETTLQCDMCGAHLKSLYALKFHIAAIHTKDRPFRCSFCQKSFVLETKLRTHVKYKHAEGGRLFHCGQCSYRAFDARGLKVHQKCMHSKERPFRCSFCPSAFALKFYLDVHLRKHTGERPYRCEECSQTFTQRTCLTRHQRRHHAVVEVAEPAALGRAKE